jgi:hypothetical protein
MRLVPTIDVYFKYSQVQTANRLDRYSDEYLRELDNDWRNSLENAGIFAISPYLEREDFWIVEISKLNPEIVKILLGHKLQITNINLAKYENVDSMLDGGYVLEVSETVKIFPRCCCDLGQIGDWELAAEWTSLEETTLWNGHPELMISSIDTQHLLIRESEWDDENIEIIVDRDELRAAIAEAKQQLADFRKMLLVPVQSSKTKRSVGWVE